MELPPLAALLGSLLLCCAGLTKGLNITSTNQPMVEKAQGEKVTLPCTFTVAQEDQGPLDIEWVLIPTDNQKKEQTIIMYSVDRIYNNYYEAMNGRVQFTNPDPRSGDGSIDILNLKSADTGTYQCRVKKAPGVESQKIQLTVLVKPTMTKCYIEGSQETGRDLTLKCVSQEGSLLLSYNWRKITGTEELPATSLLNKDTGELSLKNVSEEYSGTYSCVAANRIGTDDCFVVLNVTPPINTAGTIAGAVIGTLLGLFLLAFLVFCCCKKRKEKKYEKEVHHEIRILKVAAIVPLWVQCLPPIWKDMPRLHIIKYQVKTLNVLLVKTQTFHRQSMTSHTRFMISQWYKHEETGCTCPMNFNCGETEVYYEMKYCLFRLYLFSL
ncbi:coxsackievirus and adenovirus receptor homolog [Mauremys mutica]|uniref:coxsackievirus and adenovirus receptor homolog n=2 Tax=Mauremys mutica TaxID=74926 RepID=UPI001D15473A|nr:coxsackievirus and adenovirus receptor homolog [Mauremys mutica]